MWMKLVNLSMIDNTIYLIDEIKINKEILTKFNN
jgi:hypothetical protein